MKFFIPYLLLFSLGSFGCSPTGAPSNHRASASLCDNKRSTPTVVTVHDPSSQPCTKHSDCLDGANGRCTHHPGPGGELDGLSCTYDTCFKDDDCENNEVCSCGQDDNRNQCVPANCKTDSDCSNGHWCKASPSQCGDGVILGYFCTSDEDMCLDNVDCVSGVCTYALDSEGTNRYVCITAICD